MGVTKCVFLRVSDPRWHARAGSAPGPSGSRRRSRPWRRPVFCERICPEFAGDDLTGASDRPR